MKCRNLNNKDFYPLRSFPSVVYSKTSTLNIQMLMISCLSTAHRVSQGLQTLRQGSGLTIKHLLTRMSATNTTLFAAIVSDQRLHAVSQYTPTCQAKFPLPVARITIDMESLPKADLELMHNIITKPIPTRERRQVFQDGFVQLRPAEPFLSRPCSA